MWMAILISYILNSLILFVISRLSPYDRQPEFTISNCFWFMLGGILQRSTQSLQPKVRDILLVDIHRYRLLLFTPCECKISFNFFKNGMISYVAFLLIFKLPTVFDDPFQNPEKTICFYLKRLNMYLSCFFQIENSSEIKKSIFQ